MRVCGTVERGGDFAVGDEIAAVEEGEQP